MPYDTYLPQPPLSDCVHSFWLLQSNEGCSAKERVLPTGTMELVINLDDAILRVSTLKDEPGFRSFRRSLISGPQSRFFEGEMPGRATVIGIHFRPGGAYQFLGLPANQLLNSFESLDGLWGLPATTLRDKLLEANTSITKFRILEDFLLVKMRRHLPLHSAIAFALKELHWKSRLKPISDITEQIGISQKHFIQIFSEQVGMTPKTFSRIQRFQRVVRFTERVNKVDWGSLCLTCGYYDQAHLIHEFRAFSGCTPADYLKRKTGRLNHVKIGGR